MRKRLYWEVRLYGDRISIGATRLVFYAFETTALRRKLAIYTVFDGSCLVAFGIASNHRPKATTKYIIGNDNGIQKNLYKPDSPTCNYTAMFILINLKKFKSPDFWIRNIPHP